MDVTSTPPRVEIAVSPALMDMRETTGTMTGRAETKTPVTETDAADVQRRGVEPLDLFQVGDNDDIPVPPEPPRPPLALLALEAEDMGPDASAEVASDGPERSKIEGEDEPGQVAAGDTPEAADTQPDAAAPQSAVPVEAYQTASPSPVERTVDIRR